MIIEKYEPYTVGDVKSSSNRNLFTVISTFAGGGGSSTGYRLAGGNVLAINEFVDEAVKTYSLNFPDTKVIPGDIKKITGQDFLNITGLQSGELDIFDGSPPCSAFSVSGKREKNWKGAKKDTRVSYFNDDGDLVHEGELIEKTGIKSYSDNQVVEAIEDLFFEFIRVVKDIQPKVIIAENVKGITMGAAKIKLYEFQNSFEELGYYVTHHVLSAADYGVPQARERLFFVCVRNDVADAIGINEMTLNSLSYPRSTSKHIGLRTAIQDIINDPEEEKMLEDFVEGSFQKKFLSLLPFNPEKHTKPSDKQFTGKNGPNEKGSCFNMIRPAPHLPSPTLTQQGQQRGVSGVFHYEKNRKFTIKELKRIMSLPEDFQLTGTFDQQAERCGRMVAPKMMAALATTVYENILKPYKELQNV
jgi:DNA (cytosine-5)-methyltransferase 1